MGSAVKTIKLISYKDHNTMYLWLLSSHFFINVLRKYLFFCVKRILNKDNLFNSEVACWPLYDLSVASVHHCVAFFM